MPYEGRKSSNFYSPTNYLSPLERKRLRAIENEPKATEVHCRSRFQQALHEEDHSKTSRQCRKPPTSGSLKPAKKKLLMTVPFRPPKSTAVTDASVKSVDVPFA
ncbi:hypothetical protein MRX96_024791 [Rhipicephalus microplus]